MLTFIGYRQGMDGGLGVRLTDAFKAARDRILVNYGNSYLECGKDMYDLVLNPPEAVRDCVDKPQMLRRLAASNANRFRVPRILEDLASLGGRKMVQKRVHHHGGRSIRIIEGGRSDGYNSLRRPGYYLEEFIPCRNEWRVQVVGGKTLVRLKTGGKGEIRNRRYGWRFTYPDSPCPTTVREAGATAVKTLGLDFGVADVGEAEKGLVIYEVNTAPHLTTPQVIDWWERAMTYLIQRRIESGRRDSR